MNNPLLSFDGLPHFDQIGPARGTGDGPVAERANAALETVTAPGFAAQWNAIAAELDVATEQLSRAWGASATSTAWPTRRNCARRSTPRCPVSPSFTPAWVLTSACTPSTRPLIPVDSLNPEQRQAHKNALRNFVLGGADLQGAARQRFAVIQDRQAAQVRNSAKTRWTPPTPLPITLKKTSWPVCPTMSSRPPVHAAQAEGKDGYKLTLKMPCYLPVMQFAHSSELREKLYRAYVTRASDQADDTSASSTTRP
jgi:oligopeptidase A